MDTFIILCRLGGRIGTMRAYSEIDALEMYVGNKPTIAQATYYHVIRKNELENFKNNIKKS